MIRAHVTLSMIVLAALGLCGCLVSRTTRTDLSKWEQYEWDEMGIRLERPTAARFLSMHFHSAGGICDGIDRIQVEVQKYTPEQFADIPKISPENPLSKSEDYVAWLNWLGTFQPYLAQRTRNERQLEYLHHVKARGNIIAFHVIYSHAEFTSDQRAMDEAAIHRLLMSAKPIEDVAANKPTPSTNAVALTTEPK